MTSSTDLTNITNMSYIAAAVLFIFALRGLAHPDTARRGNKYGMLGMILALSVTLSSPTFGSNEIGHPFVLFFICLVLGGIVGVVIARRVAMTGMPQLIASFHSLVGLAATLVGFASYISEERSGSAHLIEVYVGVWIGAITLTGSIVAALKLEALIRSAPLMLPGRHFLNFAAMVATVWLGILFVGKEGTEGLPYLYAMTAVALALGWHLVMCIGAADAPVVISMLNSYSGWACSCSGMAISSSILIIAGALVGSSGAILSYIMCEGMNRSFISVIMGGFGVEEGVVITDGEQKPHFPTTAQEVVDMLIEAKSVVIVPGYGLAVSRAQNVVAEIVSILRGMGKLVRFSIHPVAGRLPGHMNVLLAEADVPYDIVLEMEEINEDFAKTDVVLIIGANDTVNPDAIDNPKSVIAGMPVCWVWNAKHTVVFKRSMASGYAGCQNPLFFNENNRMLFGDAKASCEDMMGYLTKYKREFKGASHAGAQKDGYAALPDAEMGYNPPDKEEKKEEYPEPVKSIGIPKESQKNERRVAMTPTLVKEFRKLAFSVFVEKDAGKMCGFTNEQFEKAGASVVAAKDAWTKDVVAKVNPPTQAEVDLLSKESLLISFLYPAQNGDLLKKIASNGATALSMDCVPRISRAQKLDALSSMANIAGVRAVVEGARLLPRFICPQMTAAGKSPPAIVLVIGAGVAGLAAIGTAKSLGAQVRAFDTRPVVKEQVESMGASFLQVDIQEDGTGVGGYAKVMSKEFIEAEMRLFHQQAREVDMIVTTALIPGRKPPVLITADMVRVMKRGSVIIDIAASKLGGNCELSKVDECYTHPESGVHIVGYTDFPSRMCEQSSTFYTMNIRHMIDELGGGQEFDLDFKNEIVEGSVVVHKGEIVWKPPQRGPPPKAEEKEQKGTNGALSERLLDLQEEEEESAPSALSVFLGNYGWLIGVVLLVALFIGVGVGTNDEFHQEWTYFVLSIIIGYMVIWGVTPALHTPLMSLTNALSGVILVASSVELHGSRTSAPVILAIIASAVASVNVIGGFVVTERMLNMFHK